MNDLIVFFSTGIAFYGVLAFSVVWGIMLFLMPFFVFGAWRRAKQVSRSTDEVVAVLRRFERNADKELAVEGAAIARTSKLAKLSERAP